MTRRQGIALPLYPLLALLALAPFAGCGRASETQSEVAKPSESKMNKVLFVIAPRNFRDEELEVPVRILKEKGYKTVIASKDTAEALGMLGARVKPDLPLPLVKSADYSALVIVGGSGATVLWEDTTLIRLVKEFVDSKKIVGAICLGPGVLARAGVLAGLEATCFESARGELEKGGARYVTKDVVVSGNIVTAPGPQAAEAFANALAKLLSENN
jgi:protease I